MDDTKLHHLDDDRIDRRTAEKLLGTEGKPIPSGTMAFLLHMGEIPHYRIGARTVQFSRRELDTWLASKKVASAPKPRRVRKEPRKENPSFVPPDRA